MAFGFPTTTVPTPESVAAARRRVAPTLARNGAVASAHPLVSASGLRALHEGGNAVDAAVAAALTATVVLPALCGIGGDLFAIVYRPARAGSPGGGDLVAVHGSGIAPRAKGIDFYRERDEDVPAGRVMPQHGPLSVAVPGFVDGCFALLDRFGTRPFARLAETAVGYARDGVPLSPGVAGSIAATSDRLAQFPASRAVFLPDGRPPRPGDLFRQRDLARSLATIAQDGPDAFYRGNLARGIAAGLADVGGVLTPDDLADHETVASPPLATTYRDFTVYETALPTQGFVVLEALNMVEHADLAGIGLSSADAIHLMVESLKLAFADRNEHAGDPRFVATPIDDLVAKAWAARRWSEVDPARASTTARLGALQPGDTTSLCAVDGDGLMVSLIFTLSDAFGSGVVAGDTGILLTNRAGHCFSLEDGHPNQFAPGKKTMHTLNCYLIADPDGQPVLVGNTPGGDYQPQWNLQAITGLIDGRLDVQAAIEQPRWRSWPATYPAEIGNPFTLAVEDRLGEATIAELERRGHAVERLGAWGGGGSVQLIARDPTTGVLAAGSDPRSEGVAYGF